MTSIHDPEATYVGLDVHKDTISVGVRAPEAGTTREPPTSYAAVPLGTRRHAAGNGGLMERCRPYRGCPTARPPRPNRR